MLGRASPEVLSGSKSHLQKTGTFRHDGLLLFKRLGSTIQQINSTRSGVSQLCTANVKSSQKTRGYYAQSIRQHKKNLGTQGIYLSFFMQSTVFLQAYNAGTSTAQPPDATAFHPQGGIGGKRHLIPQTAGKRRLQRRQHRLVQLCFQ